MRSEDKLKHTRAKLQCLGARIPSARPVRSIERSHRGNVLKISCKRCNVVIQESGQNLPNYAEIKIIFDDSSAHISPLCTTCAQAGLDLATLEKIYCSDLLDLSDEEGDDILMHWEMLATRRPVGHIVE